MKSCKILLLLFALLFPQIAIATTVTRSAPVRSYVARPSAPSRSYVTRSTVTPTRTYVPAKSLPKTTLTSPHVQEIHPPTNMRVKEITHAEPFNMQPTRPQQEVTTTPNWFPYYLIGQNARRDRELLETKCKLEENKKLKECMNLH